MTPENYDPNTNESGDSYQSSHPYGVPEGQRHGPYQHYQQQPPVQPPRRTGSQAQAAARACEPVLRGGGTGGCCWEF